MKNITRQPSFKNYDDMFENWLKEFQTYLPYDYQQLSLSELCDILKAWDLNSASVEYAPNEFAEIIVIEL